MIGDFREFQAQDLVKTSTEGFMGQPRQPGVLIADDMALILTLLKFELESRGFNVWLAVDGDDALDLYRRNRREIDLVLLDVQMPGLDGPQTLASLQKWDPGILACFMTRVSGNYSKAELLRRGAAYVFFKPFRPDEVAYFLQMLVRAAHSNIFRWKISPKTEKENHGYVEKH